MLDRNPMTETTSKSPPRHPLTVGEVLGTAHDGDRLWDQVRAAQFQSSKAFVPLAIGASALYAACILLVFGNAANLPVLLSWYVLTIGACLGGLRLVAGWTLAASRIEVRAVWMTAAIVALPSILWAASALFLDWKSVGEGKSVAGRV